MNSIEIITVTLNESVEEEETVIKSCKNMNDSSLKLHGTPRQTRGFNI